VGNVVGRVFRIQHTVGEVGTLSTLGSGLRVTVSTVVGFRVMGSRVGGGIGFGMVRSIRFRMHWGIRSRSIGGWGVGSGGVRVSCPYCNRDYKSNTCNLKQIKMLNVFDRICIRLF